MDKRIIIFIYVLSLSSFSNFHPTNAQEINHNTLETYIVFVNEPGSQTLSGPQDLEAYYKSFLPESSVPSNGPSPSLIYSYRHVVSGFAAKLTTSHLKFMEKKEGFLFASPQRILTLHTTRTPKFLGLNLERGIWPTSSYGKGVIIGVLDTGITPEHPSFSDKGMPPPPKKWKGKCEFKKPNLCNNKLIGARVFRSDSAEPGARVFRSDSAEPEPVDVAGHGTHTSSTAAGYFVEGSAKPFNSFMH